MGWKYVIFANNILFIQPFLAAVCISCVYIDANDLVVMVTCMFGLFFFPLLINGKLLATVCVPLYPLCTAIQEPSVFVQRYLLAVIHNMWLIYKLTRLTLMML